MGKKDINTQQVVLQAAEEEFLNKGFDRTKTTEIARRAGVTHAMLHYYFRTKENLFDVVFEKKLQTLADSISATFDRDMPFLDKLKLGVEAHFNFIAADPRLPFFIYNEILCSEERKRMFVEKLFPRVNTIVSKMKRDIDSEVSKGKISYIEPQDLFLNIMSLNIFPFLTEPLIEMLSSINGEGQHKFLQRRKENNVKLILKSLQP